MCDDAPPSYEEAMYGAARKAPVKQQKKKLPKKVPRRQPKEESSSCDCSDCCSLSSSCSCSDCNDYSSPVPVRKAAPRKGPAKKKNSDCYNGLCDLPKTRRGRGRGRRGCS